MQPWYPVLLCQTTADELRRSADRDLMQGYVFSVLAFVVLFFGVGLSIYLDRRKKNRQAQKRDQV
jgi:hypothetical protein